MSIIFLRWLRLVLSYIFVCVVLFLGFYHQVTIYLAQQAAGQLHILTNTVPFREYLAAPGLSDSIRTNLNLVEKIKSFSVDSLGYKPTENYSRIYDQQNKPVLWVVTAAPRYSLDPYEWQFPLIGEVSYKGFFEEYRAHREFIRLSSLGYDVSIRTVSAWSTLGWFHDPLMSNTLRRSRGEVCNLLFHELFHATYYKAGDVNLNENLATFIADKATRMFLHNDSISLEQYQTQQKNERVYKEFLLRQYDKLKAGYAAVPASDLEKFKKTTFRMISDSIENLGIKNKITIKRRKKEVLKYQNAYFVDLRQYESLQDSLEIAFNKIYGGRIKNMVQDLTTE